jgi:hypothetical protein
MAFVPLLAIWRAISAPNQYESPTYIIVQQMLAPVVTSMNV